MIYAIGAGSSSVAGEEDRHTLDMLLADTRSAAARRRRSTRLPAMVVGASWADGRPAAWPSSPKGPWAAWTCPPATSSPPWSTSACSLIVFGSLALALERHHAAARAEPRRAGLRRRRAYVVNGLGPLVSWLEPLQKLSPFYQYAGHDPLRNGVSWLAVGVAVGTVVLLVAVAAAGFGRRDVTS